MPRRSAVKTNRRSAVKTNRRSASAAKRNRRSAAQRRSPDYRAAVGALLGGGAAGYFYAKYKCERNKSKVPDPTVAEQLLNTLDAHGGSHELKLKDLKDLQGLTMSADVNGTPVQIQINKNTFAVTKTVQEGIPVAVPVTGPSGLKSTSAR